MTYAWHVKTSNSFRSSSRFPLTVWSGSMKSLKRNQVGQSFSDRINRWECQIYFGLSILSFSSKLYIPIHLTEISEPQWALAFLHRYNLWAPLMHNGRWWHDSINIVRKSSRRQRTPESMEWISKWRAEQENKLLYSMLNRILLILSGILVSASLWWWLVNVSGRVLGLLMAIVSPKDAI